MTRFQQPTESQVPILGVLPKAFTAPQALAGNYSPLAQFGDGKAGTCLCPICQGRPVARSRHGHLLESVVGDDTSVDEPVPASTRRKQPRPKQRKTSQFSEGLHHL